MIFIYLLSFCGMSSLFQWYLLKHKSLKIWYSSISIFFFCIFSVIWENFILYKDTVTFSYIFILFKYFIYSFLAMLGLCCFMQAFSSCRDQWELLSSCDMGASHCHFSSGFSCCRPWALGAWASVVVVYGLICPHGTWPFPDQTLNQCPLHWQVDS